MNPYRIDWRPPAPTIDDATEVERYIHRKLLHALNVRDAVEMAEFTGFPQFMCADPNPFPRFRLWGRR